ncbi:YfaP family protein [Flagellimonas meridianipacifica]|uniref:TonB-dependent SusC/RagA subfamily outer membrane receptor n=1 Tax=Flagellimonas meridianipacifica TaxID=1080225 RepID=A0A2T0MCH9_9FLAO|nr:TonB-dependent receptor plug domain-containing protein [Allomuricauda pacifica]PRX55162.1 TonB-dependent SusC/RagA subfamily outer membrane receptor [Allomuricauda pacifica]
MFNIKKPKALTSAKKKLLLSVVLALSISVFYAQNSQKTTIFWDTSSSRIQRDAGLEMEYLDAYFKRFANVEVSLIGFSNSVHSKEDYSVSNGNWEILKKGIQAFEYDGATSFLDLEPYAVEGYNLIFTDGFQNAGTTNPKLQGKTVVINSSKIYDKRTINLFSILGKAEFLNLRKLKQDSLKNTSKLVEKKRQPLDSTATGLKQGVQLEEVVVTETIKESTELEATALGPKDNDAVGYAVQSIGSEKLLDAATTLNTGIQGKFSGVTIGQNDDLSQVVMRPSNSLLGNNYGLIVVDGVPLPPSQSSNNGTVFSTSFLDPRNIEDITVLKGLAATNIYGTQGANGVMLITTKTGSYGKTTNGSSNAMQLKDNYYDSKIKIDNKALVTPYLKELKKGKDVQSAYSIYLEQRDKYKDTPNYFVDVFDFFYASSPTVAFRILSNVLEMESPSYEMLRAAYLKSSQTANHQLALAIVNKLSETYPDKLQNSFDYAVSNRRLGNYQMALNTLNVLVKDKINSVPDLKGFEKSVGAEIRNLINQHRKDLDITKVDIKYQNNITYNARLVLEWSNPEAEFVVQFVNPQKRFFDWEHTMQADGRRLQEEIRQGCFTEQFEIVGAETVGDWILNITSRGNTITNNVTPTFVKCTVFKNFGKSNQKSTSYMVRLEESNEKQQLAKFTID